MQYRPHDHPLVERPFSLQALLLMALLLLIRPPLRLLPSMHREHLCQAVIVQGLSWQHLQ